MGDFRIDHLPFALKWPNGNWTVVFKLDGVEFNSEEMSEEKSKAVMASVGETCNTVDYLLTQY